MRWLLHINFNSFFKKLLIFFVSFFFLKVGYPQTTPAPPQNLNGIIASIDTLRNRLPVEKLYLHLDKPGYTVGDTLWFKAYLFEGTYFTGSETSGIYYIELANENNELIKRMKFPLKHGLGWGNIALDNTDFPAGSYTLRAYTNWMRNFGEDAIFTRNIHIRDFSEKDWLVRSDARVEGSNKTDKVQVGLQFSQSDKRPIGFREMALKVMAGKKLISESTVQTSANGTLDISFSLPEKVATNDIKLIVQDLRKGEGNRKIDIPLQLNRAANTDLQFMPEGGSLVAGIRSKVGFKAIKEDGKGIAVEGQIVNSKQQEVGRFKSFRNGIGFFELTPQAGEQYFAKLALADGIPIKSYPLPDVRLNGTALSVINSLNTDSLAVYVAETGAADSYYLVAQSRGVICYAKAINLKGTKAIYKIAKNIFPSGIARITLLNRHFQPLNERISYIDHKDNLSIKVETLNAPYRPKDEVQLKISVTDKDGNPVVGSFSLAVSDDKQLKVDSTTNSTIINHLLLASDLKGHVEAPNYYTQPGPEAFQALDNLMLTQGWTGYDWRDVFNPPSLQFLAEPEFVIAGKVTGTFSGVSGTKISLFSQRPLMMMDTVTNEKGRFVFNGLPVSETAAYKVQAYNRNNKSVAVDVEVEEWNAPKFTRTFKSIPWYLNTDSTLLQKVNAAVSLQKEYEKLNGKGVQLKEVRIAGKKIVKGSRNLNGAGEADQVLDVEDMMKAGKLNLLDLLNQQVKGFGTGSWPPMSNPPQQLTYMINGKKAKFIIDGIDAESTYHNYQLVEGVSSDEGPLELLQFLKESLASFTTEDILGIEVMHKTGYNTKYNQSFLSTGELRNTSQTTRAAQDYAYLEITTRNGRGPFIKKTPGTYLYKPLAFSLPKKFYSPKYEVKSNLNPIPDFRSTIYWDPAVVTDAEGKAVVSFYSADKPSTYSIVFEGSDMNGKAGSVFKEKFIKVGP